MARLSTFGWPWFGRHLKGRASPAPARDGGSLPFATVSLGPPPVTALARAQHFAVAPVPGFPPLAFRSAFRVRCTPRRKCPSARRPFYPTTVREPYMPGCPLSDPTASVWTHPPRFP